MKLKELISKIDKSFSNQAEVDIICIANEAFALYDMYSWVEQTRLVSYWICNWYCTDTWVGIKAFFFDNEFVAVSSKMARKNPPKFDWVSKEAYSKVKRYVESCNEKEVPEISLLDMERDFGSSYKIDYASQILPHFKASLDGKPVEMLRNKDPRSCEHEVLIRMDGKKQIINVNHLRFSYFVVSDEKSKIEECQDD